MVNVMGKRALCRMAWVLAVGSTVGCTQLLEFDKEPVEERDSGPPVCEAMSTAPEDCPHVAGASEMRALPGGYCIDKTEVSWRQYDLWLAGANPSGQDPVCSWNDSFIPDGAPVEDKNLDKPVTGVDWCDAYAYCRGVGKRLCGAIAGGAVSTASANRCGVDQWYTACSSAGKYAYPYGDVRVDQVCNDSSNQQTQTVNVAEMKSCQSRDPEYWQVWDLSGNVWEWEDSCDDETGKSDHCGSRGGSFDPNDDGPACAGQRLRRRDQRLGQLGFRCCT